MTTNQSKNPSDFAAAALALDAEFQQFERLAREIERLEINSDKGLDRSKVLLTEVDACRQRMATAMQDLGRTLEEARARSEEATGLVAGRADEIHARHLEAQQMLERFKVLGEMVRKVNDAVATLRKADGTEVSAADKAEMAAQLPQVNDQLGVLVDEARKLMDDAHRLNMKTLERNADSLRQSLTSARHRLVQFVEQHRGDAH